MTARRDRDNSAFTPQPRPIEPGEARDLLRQGCTVVDARAPARYGYGHIQGAFNVYLRGHEFAARVAKVTPADARLILVVEDVSDAPRAAQELARAGRRTVEGYLAGDLAAWQKAGLPTMCTEQIPVGTLQEIGERQILDVRESDEWAAGRIPGAIHIPYHELDRRVDELDPDRPIAVYCARGQRSSLATSILERHGFRYAANVEGGFTAWQQAGYEPMREERPIPSATKVQDLGYGLKVTLDLPFAETLARVEAAIRATGMQIVAQTDLRSLLEEKRGVQLGNFRILGTYDRELAYDAVQAVPDVGLFLPCNVLVYEEDGRSVVAVANPEAIVGLVRHPALGDCASALRAKLETVLQRVRQGGLRKAA